MFYPLIFLIKYFSSGKFDHADRLFFGIQRAFELSSSAGGMSDVKELTPEMYSVPECLLNSNGFDLGMFYCHYKLLIYIFMCFDKCKSLFHI